MKQSILKNATAYRVTPGWKLDPDLLLRRLASDCGDFEARTDGFAPPCGHSTHGLAHDIGDGVRLIAFQTQERLLPGHVVDETVAERAADIEEAQGYKPGRKELREIKQRVIEELLPKAFTATKRTYALFVGDYFIIDTSSPARAEAVIEALRKALDELPLSLIHTNTSPSVAMRGWLLGETPWNLTVDDSTVLEGPEENKPTVSYQRIDLDSSEIRNRIADGFTPRKVAVTVGERVSIMVDDCLRLTRIQPAGLLRVEADEQTENAEDMQAEFDGTVLLMATEVRRTLDSLIDMLGGIVEPEADLVTASDKLDDMAREDGGTVSISIPGGETIATFGDGPDPLYDQAKAIVVANRRPSISLVQRHLRIGYNRAASLIERMESDGIVSAMDASGIREVLA